MRGTTPAVTAEPEHRTWANAGIAALQRWYGPGTTTMWHRRGSVGEPVRAVWTSVGSPLDKV